VGGVSKSGGERQDAIAASRTRSREYDVPITTSTVHASLPIRRDNDALTDAQREALGLEHERGDFDTPRGVSLEEIADELDVPQ